MAYRFTGASSSRVQFGIAPFNGYTFGAFTIAAFVKRASTTDFPAFVFFSNAAGSTNKLEFNAGSGSTGLRLSLTGEIHNYAASADTTNWWLVVATCAGTGQPVRFHIHDGTSWLHASQSGGAATLGTAAIGATDTLFVSAPLAWGGEYLNGDIVCAGVKKGDSTDLQVETLSRTSFPTWNGFGFDWLAGFEASGTILNRANPGSGDETARTAVSLVSDPPGWLWTAPVTYTDSAPGTVTASGSGVESHAEILGYNTPGATAVSLGTGRMQVSRFTLSRSGTLRELHGWFARGASTVRLVIYRHVSGANPYGTAALVAYTSPISLAGSGNAEISQAGFSVHLPAGDYYIGARSDVAGALHLGTNQGLGYVGVDSGAADPPSDPFPSSPTASGSTQLSCWAAVDPDVAYTDSASGTVTASGTGVESRQDPTILGYTARVAPATPVSGLSGGRLYVSKFTLPSAATLTELHAWFTGNGSLAVPVRLVVYAADGPGGNPGTRLAYTGKITVPISGPDFEAVATGLSVPLAAADYWLGWKSDAGGATQSYGDGTAGTHYGYTTGAPDPPPDPFGTGDTSGTRKHSVWGVVALSPGYTDSASGTVTASGSGVESHTASVTYTDSASGIVTASGSGVESHTGAARMVGSAQFAFRTGPKPVPHDPQPGLGALLYNSDASGHWAVHRAPTTVGGTSTPISGTWEGHADAFNPAWGPDGRVVFPVGGGDLLVADGDGGFPVAIESAAGVDNPSWSPDGALILGYDYSDIVTVDPVSGDRQVLVEASAFRVNLSPQAWSFDQTQVVFADNFTREVWVANSDGTGLTEVTPIGVGANATPATVINYPSWSPVEDKIAVSDGYGVYVFDGDGNNVHLVYAATDVWALAWSPDGKKLALNNSAGIAVVNVDGTGFTQVVADSTAWRPDWSRRQPPIAMTAVTGGGGPASTTVSMTGVASFAFSTDASLWYPPLGPRIPGAFYDRWKSGLHIGDSRPGQRVQVRRGRYFRRHGKWLGNDPMAGVHIVGYNLSNPWQAYWTPQSAYVDVPNVREVRFDQSTDQNGITTATVVIDNIFYRPEAGGQHTIERGQYASLRGYVAPDRTRLTDEQGQPVFPDATWFGMLIQDAQITVNQSYGNQRIKTFTGLIDDVDTTSRPDVITVTARDFGKVLNDSFMFGWNKEQPDEGETLFRDPTVFIDPDDADKTEVVGDNAAASSGSGSADNVVDGDGDTSWTSASHTSANYTEYVQVRLSEGRYNDFNVNVASDGLEMYVSLLPKNLNNGDSPTRNGTDIPNNQWVNGSGGATVPGDNGGIYYIRHIASVSEGVHHYNLTSDEDSFRVGDDSILRLSFRNLKRPAGSTRYSASVTAVKPLSRTLVPEAKKQHWVLVDDASDVVRVILRWAGFKEFEVESTGTSLSKRFIVNRGMTYMEAIKQIAELSGYIFFMSDPSPRPDSLGVPIFRKSQIVTDAPSVVTVSDRDLLTAIDVKQTDEPLAYIIRMRGRESKKGRRLGGDLTRRVMYVYRPPWSGGHDKPPPTAGVRPPSHQLGGILRHVIHTNHMFKTIDDCKFACFYLALNEAIAASTTTIQIPANPGVQLDDHVELLDLATGVTSRLSVQQRSSEFVRSGEDTHWVMTLAGGLVDTPDISDVVYAINTAKRA